MSDGSDRTSNDAGRDEPVGDTFDGGGAAGYVDYPMLHRANGTLG